MPEKQAPETPSPLAAPPGRRLLDTDAVGVCAEGLCTLPATAPTSAEAEDSSQAGTEAGSSAAD